MAAENFAVTPLDRWPGLCTGAALCAALLLLPPRPTAPPPTAPTPAAPTASTPPAAPAAPIAGERPAAMPMPIPSATPAPQRRLVAGHRSGPWNAPPPVKHLADQVLASNDNEGRAFVIIDKRNARIHAVGADGRQLGDAPVLLGAARGDDSVPGIGERPIALIRPFERTTPAGRFVAAAGVNAHGEDIVWVDYDAAISMHRVRATNPKERRLQRLASASVADNRISYGCINMPPAFFDGVISPMFRDGEHAVYVLPEVKPVQQLFAFGRGTPVAHSGHDQQATSND